MFNPLIQSEHLTKTYYKGSVEVRALHDVTFIVREGEFVSIVGRSGSGKSTLLNCIGGLDTATSGAIRIAGKELTSMKRLDLALHRRFTVGMIFQSFNLIPSRTALENVTLALAFGGMPRRKRKQAARSLLNQVGLSERMDHTPGELSGGESQRVAIARSLANNPRILLADEPTGNLDSKTSDEIVNLLRQLNREKGLTVLMVTHDEDAAELASHHIIRLLDGCIMNQETDGRPA